MSPPDWHAPAAVLARYLDEPEALDEPTAASLEQHLLACPACRHAAAELGDRELVAASWARVADIVDRPRASATERVLRAIGSRDDHARLVAATPVLRTTTAVLALGLAAVAAIVARVGGTDGPFLVLAPVAPLAAVALAFAAGADPAGEVAVVTPVHGAGLVLRRAGAVLGATCVLLGLASAALPEPGLAALAWALPALACALGSLALATWWRIEAVAATVAATWVVGLTVLRVMSGSVGDTFVFRPPGQAVAVLATAVAAYGLVARREQLGSVASWR
jgi:hypothetical protein